MDMTKVGFKFKLIKTKVLEKAFHSGSDEEVAINRIRKRIKALGKRYEDGNSTCRGYTYHPIPFPEFQDARNHRDASGCESRLDVLQSETQLGAGDRVLDIGANVGFFSFSLVNQGVMVDSVELQSDSFEIGAALSKLYKKDVNYINKPVSLELLNHLGHQYQCVLLLSVVHWIMKQKGKDETLAILQKISSMADTIFFEVPSSENDGLAYHQDFSSIESVRVFVSEAFPGRNAIELMQGKAWGNRVLFKIS